MLIKGVPNSIIDACEGLGGGQLSMGQFHLKADAFHKPIFSLSVIISFNILVYLTFCLPGDFWRNFR